MVEALAHEAVVNVTFAGQNFDLPNAVAFDAQDGDVKGWVAEAIRTGSVPGIDSTVNVDLRDFIVERFPAPTNPVQGQRTSNMLQLRPKTAYGAM